MIKGILDINVRVRHLTLHAIIECRKVTGKLVIKAHFVDVSHLYAITNQAETQTISMMAMDPPHEDHFALSQCHDLVLADTMAMIIIQTADQKLIDLCWTNTVLVAIWYVDGATRSEETSFWRQVVVNSAWLRETKCT